MSGTTNSSETRNNMHLIFDLNPRAQRNISEYKVGGNSFFIYKLRLWIAQHTATALSRWFHNSLSSVPVVNGLFDVLHFVCWCDFAVLWWQLYLLSRRAWNAEGHVYSLKFVISKVLYVYKSFSKRKTKFELNLIKWSL